MIHRPAAGMQRLHMRDEAVQADGKSGHLSTLS
jgi:hypothetical protein